MVVKAVTSYYAKFYVDEIVQLHGILVSIISYHGPQFTSHFLKAFQKALGTRRDLSMAFHPQTDSNLKGQSRH